MVYRKKSGHIAFNEDDILKFINRYFNMANTKEELYLIKNKFNELMDITVKDIEIDMTGNRDK